MHFGGKLTEQDLGDECQIVRSKWYWPKLTVLACASLWFAGQLSFASAVDASLPSGRIQLSDCGYAMHKPRDKKHVHLADLALDENTRVALSGHTLAIYFSDWSTYKMEALFIDVESGKCIDRRSWPIAKRVGLNDSADTQARILVTSGGFLVHAGVSLVLYSPSLEVIATYPLGGYGMPFSKRGIPEAGVCEWHQAERSSISSLSRRIYQTEASGWMPLR